MTLCVLTVATWARDYCKENIIAGAHSREGSHYIPHYVLEFDGSGAGGLTITGTTKSTARDIHDRLHLREELRRSSLTTLQCGEYGDAISIDQTTCGSSEELLGEGWRKL